MIKSSNYSLLSIIDSVVSGNASSYIFDGEDLETPARHDKIDTISMNSINTQTRAIIVGILQPLLSNLFI